VLQSVFESTYNFSLEHAKKHSLAHGLKTLEGLHGVPPFVIQHVAATALGESDLYHSFQVDGRETSVRIRALSVGVEYLFVVDALNEAGRTVGTQLVRA
jgi:hypothetical protein